MSPARRLPLVYLALGVVCSALGNGAHAVAPFAWLAPIFYLRFFAVAAGSHGLRRRFVLAGVANGLAVAVAMRGMVPAPAPIYAVMCLLIGFGALTPVVLHTLLRPWLPRALALWVLPLALAAADHLMTRLSPFGSWGALAYSQAGLLPLVQSAAVAGLWALPLLMGLVASAVAEVWRVGLKDPSARRGLALAIGLILGTGLFGQLRLNRNRARAATPPAPEVTVAVVSSVLSEPLSELLRPLYEAGPIRWPEIFAQAERVRADLLLRTRSAALQGARFVVWPETAAVLPQAEEAAFLTEAGAVAREGRIYLAAALGTVLRTERGRPGDKLLDNQVVLLDPDGRELVRYHKSIPVPGAEEALIQRGEGPPPIVQTPHGRVALLICFDLDFPSLVRDVARRGAELVLAPAEDWRDIDPYHSRMATFRAVESGLSLVRAARYGLSIGVDRYGQVRAASDYFGPARAELIAAVPVVSERTPYVALGDWLGWLSLGLLGALWLWAARGILRNNRHNNRRSQPA